MKRSRYLAGLLLLFACNNKQPQQGTEAVKPPTDTLIASWSVKGCAELAKRPDTKFPDKGEFSDYPDLPFPGLDTIRAAGDSVLYERFVHHGCCRKAKIGTERQGNVITITEYWWGQICKCMCQSTLHAVINKLPPGKYQVYAVETGTDPITDKPAGGRDTVMRKVVEIK